MGTRFLMTRDCPVPQLTKERYTRASTDDILVTTRVDGIPQRMIRNETLVRIEKAGHLRMLLLALASARQMKRLSGVPLGQLLVTARRMAHASELTFGQALMAAIAPVMFQRAMLSGEPQHGLLATGQVAGRLQDLPSCEELVGNIVREARERLAALGVTPLAAA
jgi:NAD(P)H-dependent flavin oxidoreductase YrpB (nitropropane dioxygenase family)